MSEDPDSLVARVRTLFEERKHEEVVPLLEQLYAETGNERHLASLGIAYLRCDRLEEAKDASNRALDALGEDPGVLDALTEIHGRLSDLEATIAFGRRSLRQKDREVCAAYRGPLGAPKVPSKRHRKLISYSLYGDQPKYCEGAVLNVEAARELYPGFVCRFYIDEQVPTAVRVRLESLGAELVPMDNAKTAAAEEPLLPGMFWRFLALDDPDADVVLVRDADSLPTEREKTLVESWLASDYDFHIIRDWYTHGELILGGTFAARPAALPPVMPEIEQFLDQSQRPGFTVRFLDQILLRYRLWPAVRNRTLTHDRFFKFGVHVAPNEAGGPGRMVDHIGANMSIRGIQRRAPDPNAETVSWRLLDEDSGIVCAYDAPVDDGHIVIVLPRAYIVQIEAGRYRIEID